MFKSIERVAFVERNRATGGLDLYLQIREYHNGNIAKVTVLAAAEQQVSFDNGDFLEAKPTTVLDREQAQQLVDQLYAFGIRPSDGVASSQAISAVQRHLEDMRSIAFKSLNLEPKQ